MNLNTLNKTVIIIDTDFLNEHINFNLSVYKNVYPNKKFDKMDLSNLVYQLASNARVKENEMNKLNVNFVHTRFESVINHCKPNNLITDISANGLLLKNNSATIQIRSVMADENETCSTRFIKVLRILNQSTEVSRIIMIADNSNLNFELMNDIYTEKDLFFLKKYRNSEILGGTINYVNIDYPVAYALGVKHNEL